MVFSKFKKIIWDKNKGFSLVILRLITLKVSKLVNICLIQKIQVEYKTNAQSMKCQ